MPFDFPITGDQARNEAISRINALRAEYQFDAILGDLIAARIESSARLRGKISKNTREILRLVVSDVVGPHLAVVIMDSDLRSGHTFDGGRAVAGNGDDLYRKEDRIQKIVRSIVESVYSDASFEVHRSKTKGALNTIFHVVNSQDFVGKLRQRGEKI